MEIHTSARKHGVPDEDILHAIDHALAVEDAGEEPDRWLVLGPDRAANLLELVVMTTRESDQLDSCHADSSGLPSTPRPMTEDRNYGRTRDGRPITEAEVRHLANEAERGYDVDRLLKRRSKRGRPTLGNGPAGVESVRLDPDLREELLARAESDGTTTSDVIRKALRRYLRGA